MSSKLLLIFLLYWLTACSSTAYLKQKNALKNARQTSIVLDDVPFVKQRTKHCGPASLASVMQWLGLEANPDALAPQLYIDARNGSLQNDLLGAARRHGLLAYEHKGKFKSLLQQLQAGVPVIVLQNLATSWAPVWHYSVVVGYDASKEHIFLHDGYHASKTVNFKYFEYTWRHADYWALSLHKPGDIPEGSTPTDYVYAAHGLELANRQNEALLAYQSASERWPDNFIARMGQGNIHYQSGNYLEALKAYQQASRLKPNSAEALHNLAWALLRNGKKNDAVETMNSAIATGGSNTESYRAALQEILLTKQ